MKIVTDLNFHPHTNTPDSNAYKYEGKSVWGKYLGPSRIDECPMFQIDTFQLDREKKIEEILK